MSDQCVFCHEFAARPARISLDLGRGDIHIHVDGVPARHCDACGSDGIDGPLAEELSEGIDRVLRAIEAAQAVPAEA
jgi:YgiT-type zinc finger domain-containing protein